MSKIALIITFVFSCSSIANADTLIRILTDEGNITEVKSNGTTTRIEMAPEPGYVLINHIKHSVYIIIPEEKMIMNMSAKTPTNNIMAKLDIKIRAVGNGPKIAGYATKKYTLTANGDDCGIIYGSKKALKNKNIRNIYNAVNEMVDNQNSMMGEMSQMMDACDRAETDLSEQTKIMGLPLKTVDKNGSVTSEIKSINTHAKISASAYKLPSGYRMTSMENEMLNMQNKMPNIEQMMQSGQISPEDMKQLQEMQNMLKQFQE